MNEIETRNCKICGKPAKRIQQGTFTKKGSRRWVGEDGKQWNGLKCPDCQRNHAKVNMRRLRAGRKDSGISE